MARDTYADNINVLKEIAKQIRATDLLDPSSRTVSLMTEIIDRCKKLPQLEMVDFNVKYPSVVEKNEFEIDNIEGDA
tara:strand:- start:6164 stop:6394 length:231 start_codon:yes stop_codon:yes gene_type:complete